MPSATVECREAAGSVSADWVVVWSSVCLGIFRFARDAEDGRFWAVIARLAEAEAAALSEDPEQQQKQQYDMISLLFDMGLFAEGLFLERKLRADPMSFWFPSRLVEGEEIAWPVPVRPVGDADDEVRPLSGPSSDFALSPKPNSWERGSDLFGDSMPDMAGEW